MKTIQNKDICNQELSIPKELSISKIKFNEEGKATVEDKVAEYFLSIPGYEEKELEETVGTISKDTAEMKRLEKAGLQTGMLVKIKNKNLPAGFELKVPEDISIDGKIVLDENSEFIIESDKVTYFEDVPGFEIVGGLKVKEETGEQNITGKENSEGTDSEKRRNGVASTVDNTVDGNTSGSPDPSTNTNNTTGSENEGAEPGTIDGKVLDNEDEENDEKAKDDAKPSNESDDDKEIKIPGANSKLDTLIKFAEKHKIDLSGLGETEVADKIKVYAVILNWSDRNK